MRPPDRPDERRVARAALFVPGVTLAVGVAWFTTELVLFVVSDASQDRSEILRHAGDLVVWQLALFALLGLALVPLAHVLALRRADVGWWAVGAASFVFLGARVGEGALRQGGSGRAALAVTVAALVLTGLLVALRGVGRLLPPALCAVWPLAVWSGWTLLFVGFLRRAGPALGNGKTGLTGWVEFLHAGDALLATALGGIVLLGCAALRRFGPRARLAP